MNAFVVRALIWGAVASVLSAVCASAADSMAHPSEYLAEDGQLRAQLELKDAQDGFAGISGTMWTIERDGTVKAARFVNARVDPPRRVGQLTKDDLAKLAEVLSAQGFSGLAPELGREQKVNARRITVTFGGKSSTWVLPPGQDPVEAAAAQGDKAGSAEKRFLAIEQAVRKLVN
jgi:hypothetical protein